MGKGAGTAGLRVPSTRAAGEGESPQRGWKEGLMPTAVQSRGRGKAGSLQHKWPWEVLPGVSDMPAGLPGRRMGTEQSDLGWRTRGGWDRC